MMTLITGGVKNGKSYYAERILERFHGKKFYIATMIPRGEEAHTVIARHRKNRIGKGFETIEAYTDIDKIILPDGCGVLLECVTNLCANEMFEHDKVQNPVEKIITGFKHLKSSAAEFVIVTNEVSCEGITYDSGTMEYVKNLSEINHRTAELSDNVIECVCGIPLVLKGRKV